MLLSEFRKLKKCLPGNIHILINLGPVSAAKNQPGCFCLEYLPMSELAETGRCANQVLPSHGS